MRVLFRLEAGYQVGLGHHVRSLSIARVLRHTHKAELVLATSDPSKVLFNEWRVIGKTIQLADEDELRDIVAEQNPDVLVIDRLYDYPVDQILELRRVIPIVMIHPIGECRFNADVVIYPNGHMADDILFDDKWNLGNTKLHHGMEYILMSDAVIPRKDDAKPSYPPQRINVIAGGSDPGGVLLKLMPLLGNADLGIPVYGLVGSSYQDRNNLAGAISNCRGELHLVNYGINDVLLGDLTICAFGVTAYELIYLGLPLITLGHVELNALSSRRFAERFSINEDFGVLSNLDNTAFTRKVQNIVKGKHPEFLGNAHKGKELIDGRGAERCANLIVEAPSVKG